MVEMRRCFFLRAKRGTPALAWPARDSVPATLAMKLLLYSHFFSPSVGGVETVVLALATTTHSAALFSWDRHAEEIHRLLRDAAVHRA